MNIKEVADSIGVCKRTLYNMIEDGRFPIKPVKGTKPRRWNPEFVNAWKARQ